MSEKEESFLLQPIESLHVECMLQLEVNNREFFQTFTPLRHSDFYTLEGQRERLNMIKRMRELRQQYTFGIFAKDTGDLIGDASLFKIEREPVHSCMLGYCLDQDYNGRGYMSIIVKRMVSFAFGELKLHRIEAGAMPHNKGSIRVLEKAGFHKEGIAVKSVRINGKWEDHQMMAIINNDV
ncbi:GNAT family N-acetyltransferase [Fictibacillus fluitans]|uniref:GNAT family protein n=1 Tax=Fictibacillus fluitans TaxID=3058422 RepID=A0ABT8HV02_9BACL|nr:GNAT family protein [Fictibacillus sp. NE201]MDN4524596.1 GNAT family protein [Fictibacillus sp. NE201]